MKFRSKYPNVKYVVKPTGLQVINGIPVVMAGKSIQFEHGEYDTNDEAEIEFLKGKADFGITLFAEEDKKEDKKEKKPAGDK
jgi:hypothetical protein